MGSGCAVGITSLKLIKNILKFVATGNDNTGTNCAQIKEKAKVVQISVKKRIFVVPFYFKGNTVL